MKKNTNLSMLTYDERCSYLSKNWSIIKSSVEDILKNHSNLDEEEVYEQLPKSFNKKLVLGQGMWGLVLRLKNHKIVVKVTSDLLELSLVDLILSSDSDLMNHKGIPHIAGSDIFPDLNGIIVRENLNTGGVVLNASSPITRAVNTIINDFVVPLSSDEIQLDSILKGLNKGTIRDLTYAHIIIKGNSIKYANRAFSKIKQPYYNSKSYHVVKFIKKLLKTEGVGLVDLHSDNLAFPKYDIEDVFGVKRSKDDFKKFVISDLGLAYDSPVMALHEDYENLDIDDDYEDRHKHLSKVLTRLIDIYYQPYEDLTYANGNLSKERDALSYYIIKERDRKNPHDDNPSSKLFNHIDIVAFQYISKGLNFADDDRFSEYVYRITKDINSVSGYSLDQDRMFNSIMQVFIKKVNYLLKNSTLISNECDSVIPFYSSSRGIKDVFSRSSDMIPVEFDFDLLHACFNKQISIKDLSSDRFIIFAKIDKESDHLSRVLNTLESYDGENIIFSLYLKSRSIVSINGIEKLELSNGF